jgi:hypothetical protein
LQEVVEKRQKAFQAKAPQPLPLPSSKFEEKRPHISQMKDIPRPSLTLAVKPSRIEAKSLSMIEEEPSKRADTQQDNNSEPQENFDSGESE